MATTTTILAASTNTNTTAAIARQTGSTGGLTVLRTP